MINSRKGLDARRILVPAGIGSVIAIVIYVWGESFAVGAAFGRIAPGGTPAPAALWITEALVAVIATVVGGVAADWVAVRLDLNETETRTAAITPALACVLLHLVLALGLARVGLIPAAVVAIALGLGGLLALTISLSKEVRRCKSG